jgi:hypothetical protein
MATNNYTLGRGKIYFARFQDGTQLPASFMYIGNTPEFNLTIESEELEHYSSDEGIREKDDSVPLEVTRTGSLITDNIDPENVALFFFGEAETVSQSALTTQSDTFASIIAGRSYQLGVTAGNPVGVRGIAPSTYSAEISGGGTGLVEGTDYELDRDNGLIHFLDTSIVAVDGVSIDVDYDLAAMSYERVISGSEPVEGAMKYVAFNPKGTNFDYHLPYVKVTPNGDFALKGDEWQQIPFSIEALKPTNAEAIYMNGRPVYS